MDAEHFELLTRIDERVKAIADRQQDHIERCHAHQDINDRRLTLVERWQYAWAAGLMVIVFVVELVSKWWMK